MGVCPSKKLQVCWRFIAFSVRGHAPEDYELMVVTKNSLLDMVADRAKQLLAAGRALGSGVKVSRREQDVLEGILQRLANKEIASRLHVSERTVKFHVSSLLAKFGVTDRVALSREVSPQSLAFHASREPAASSGFIWLSGAKRGRIRPQSRTPPGPPMRMQKIRGQVVRSSRYLRNSDSLPKTDEGLKEDRKKNGPPPHGSGPLAIKACEAITSLRRN